MQNEQQNCDWIKKNFPFSSLRALCKQTCLHRNVASEFVSTIHGKDREIFPPEATCQMCHGLLWFVWLKLSSSTQICAKSK